MPHNGEHKVAGYSGLSGRMHRNTHVGRMSRAFLPSAVYHLEEYGLPRMVSKKIHRSGLINFEQPEMDLLTTLAKFNQLGIEKVLSIRSLSSFDRYIVQFFFDGITVE